MIFAILISCMLFLFKEKNAFMCIKIKNLLLHFYCLLTLMLAHFALDLCTIITYNAFCYRTLSLGY